MLCLNSAHPSLIFSESMTRMRVGVTNGAEHYVEQHLPDNPKRFQHCICVLGLKGFTSGKHDWEVEVDQGTRSMISVLTESVKRKYLRDLSTQNGDWVINPYTTNWMQWLLEFFAPKKRNPKQIDHLTLQVNPKMIGIYLDYEGGQVSFYYAENMSDLYTHSGRMTGKVFSVSNNQMKLHLLSA
ncbi:zinc-binding protein A33-like [Heterodontus francisci]|uniref:zinc-binding protein A33-like n=1 Tax=Heterodontus francisci TaxID=7792 RepID=UPI00355C197D